MRKIKFRGKPINKHNNVWDANWYKGLLQPASYERYAISVDYIKSWDDFLLYEVNPDTIGQFTGFSDVKGNEIYEGDIVTYIRQLLDGTGFLECGYIEWSQDEGRWLFVNRFKTLDGRKMVTPIIRLKDILVVGNIYDNPELLQGGC